METTLKKITNPLQSQILRIGILFIALASTIFVLSDSLVLKENLLPISTINYILLIIFVLINIPNFKNKEFPRAIKTALWFQASALGFISCFSMNRNIEVFKTSATWLNVIIAIFIVLCVLQPIADTLSKWLKITFYAALGVCLLMLNYYAIILVPIYAFGLIGIIFFGVGIHAFIPALISLLIIIHIVKTQQIAKMSFLGGYFTALVLIIVGVFIVSKRVDHINKLCNYDAMNNDGSLPTWINVAQQLDNNYLNYHILKNEFNNRNLNLFSFGEIERSFNNDVKQKHDPLVTLSCLFTPNLELTKDDKLKTLISMNNNSNLSESRLWDGFDLKTKFVGTHVAINTAERIAYTEKLLSIVNTKKWGTQEAIYTFTLPKDGVVTGLSLWINGVEEKAVLTSKNKATNAYNTIVGVENRDPSVIHWKEGNTVSVRVFPCNNIEDRKVKICIAAPMKVENNKLIYETIKITGTDLSDCEERIQIREANTLLGIDLPYGFDKENNQFVRESKLDLDFSFSLNCPRIMEKSFSHNGYTYSLIDLPTEYDYKTTNVIYLDLNKSWTKNDLESVLSTFKDKTICYATPSQELVYITIDDLKDVYEYAREIQFSLFPFYLINKPEHSLVITKSGKSSPSLAEISESNFGKNLLAKPSLTQYDIYNIGSDENLYLGSLNQYNFLNNDFGSIEKLSELVSNNKFVKNKNSEPNLVLLPQNKTAIVRTKETKPNNGSDFLARLFAYKKITQEYYPIFAKTTSDSSLTNQLVTEGQIANVVTPITSLIVLETQKDYERFDIKNKTKTLDNSSIFKNKEAGAAPEPHEWALIILCGLMLVLFYKDSILRKMFGYAK